MTDLVDPGLARLVIRGEPAKIEPKQDHQGNDRNQGSPASGRRPRHEEPICPTTDKVSDWSACVSRIAGSPTRHRAVISRSAFGQPGACSAPVMLVAGSAENGLRSLVAERPEHPRVIACPRRCPEAPRRDVLR